MKALSQLQKELEPFEHSDDATVLPGLYIVARLDGKNFHKLKLEEPFDSDFSDCMIKTAKFLLSTDFQTILSYTQSDEISVLLSPKDNTFNRKIRKINSIFAGYASVIFYEMFRRRDILDPNKLPVFDCRTLQFPDVETVVKYFTSRQMDARKNCINTLATYVLTHEKEMSKQEAHNFLDGISLFKRIDLFNNMFEFHNVENRMKNGILLCNPNTSTTIDCFFGKKFRRHIRRVIYNE